MSNDTIDRARNFFGTRLQEDPAAARRFGKYEVIRELGAGGMGVVLEALDTDLGRKVALKFRKGGTGAQVRREAMAAAGLRHPNIVTIYEVADDFIAMEHVPGRTLSQAIANMSMRERIETLAIVAAAAGYAHSRGVIHRDIKPDNVLLDDNGRVFLADFGLAQAAPPPDPTRPATVMGTPDYMSPEQVHGDLSRVGPTSDVWSLGVILYEMATGSKPFTAITAREIHEKILARSPSPIPGELGAVIGKALEKDPARRYADAAAMADDLRRYLAGEPVAARPIGRLARRWRRMRRARLALALGASTLVTAGAALGLALYVKAQRTEVIDSLRANARTSLEAALELRRSGSLTGMRRFLPPLEAAYRRAVERAPALAEPDYLMGRMYRALLDDDRALVHQDKAIAKDARFAPALYERAVLLSLQLARENKITRGTGTTPGEMWPQGPQTPSAGLEDLRHAAREAWRAFLSVPPAARTAAPGFRPGDATDGLGRGVLDYLDGALPRAQRQISVALQRDPELEEGWEATNYLWSSMAVPDGGLEGRWRHMEDLLTARIERDHGYAPHYFSRGEVRWARGSLRRHNGRDPIPDYDGARADFGQAANLNPKSALGWSWRGRMNVYAAMWAIETKRDPRADCARAEADLTLALDLDPTHGDGWIYRGIARALQGAYLSENGQSPWADFTAAESHIAEARRIDPAYVKSWQWYVRSHHVRAFARAKRDASALFAVADKDLVFNPNDDPWTLLFRGWFFTERAADALARGRDPSADLAAARQLLDRGVERDPDIAENWRRRGDLNWQRARYLDSTRNRTAAAKAYAAAASDLARALTINPTLSLHIQGTLSEARRKAAGAL